jgi:hypothetical protein
MSSYLIIDAENIKVCEEDLIFLKIKYGIDEIIIYFDMEKNNISTHYNDWIFKYSCHMIHVESIGGKNSVDLQISIDLTEWCIKNKNIKTIILASNDRDFYPLCHKLKTLQKKMVIVAFQKINETLATIIDSFELIGNIPIDLQIILHCFLIENKTILTLSYLKKLLKKINKKKKMDDYNHLIDNISSKWNNIFDIEENNIILKLPKK